MEEAIETTASAPELISEAEVVMEAVTTGNVTSEVLSDFGKALLAYIPTVIAAILLYFIGKLIAKCVIKIIDRGMGRTRIDDTARSFLKSLLSIVFSAFAIVIALSVLGIPMTSIITAIGAAGVAIGLALQNSLSNVAGGFIILFTKPFGKGDYIITNGIEGIVDEITILSTRLITIDNKVVYIPNGMVSSSPITNFSHEEKRRVDLVFSIAYGENFKRAIDVIKEIMTDHELVLKGGADEPFVRVCELGESSVNLTARAWTKTENYWTVYFDLIEGVKSKFDELGIEIPYNKLDVNIMNK